MEYRTLGRDGPRVSALAFGTGTFGGVGRMFSAWGTTDAQEARRLIDICVNAGLTPFDTADNYSDGLAEMVLGEAIAHRPNDVLVATKTTLPIADSDGGGSWLGTDEVSGCRRPPRLAALHCASGLLLADRARL